jgi:hypothetical protein
VYAQLVFFDGPRSPELVAASDRAGTERIVPTLRMDDAVRDAVVATYVLRTPDGGDVVVIVAETAEALQRGNELIRHSPLLDGEDPALLPGPNRVQTLPVVRAFGRNLTPIGVPS